MNECYCWTHRYKRQGSHAPPSLSNLVPVKHAARSGPGGPTYATATVLASDSSLALSPVPRVELCTIPTTLTQTIISIDPIPLHLTRNTVGWFAARDGRRAHPTPSPPMHAPTRPSRHASACVPVYPAYPPPLHATSPSRAHTR